MFRQKAFTLFEVLIALGIFAIVVIGLMAALNTVLTASGEIRSSENVRSQMQNRLSQLEGGRPKEAERKIKIDYPKMTITERVKKEVVVNDKRTVLNGFWRVTVLAEWDEAGVTQKQEATFLRYSP